MRILMLGEALVDLVCERPVGALGEARAFVPHPGGAVANAAAAAAALGAEVELLGGAGDDDWGRWLRDGLERAGVGLTWFGLLPQVRTPVALVTVDATGEPTFQIYGQDIASTVLAQRDHVDAAVESCGALFVSSNTLVGEDERAVTMAARRRALELGRPLVVDPNLRVDRWPMAARAAATVRELVPGAFLVRSNLAEAELLTGEPEPARAADALLAAGARHVVITRGADGAILRGGGLRLDVGGVPAQPVDTTGAGDTLTGTLLARLAASGFYPPTLAAALPEAVERAARSTERFGARGGRVGRAG